MEIEGPYIAKGVDGLKVPLYIFAPGAVRMEIGEVTVTIDTISKDLSFDVVPEDPYKDVAAANFDVPMRFVVINREETPKGE